MAYNKVDDKFTLLTAEVASGSQLATLRAQNNIRAFFRNNPAIGNLTNMEIIEHIMMGDEIRKYLWETPDNKEVHQARKYIVYTTISSCVKAWIDGKARTN